VRNRTTSGARDAFDDPGAASLASGAAGDSVAHAGARRRLRRNAESPTRPLSPAVTRSVLRKPSSSIMTNADASVPVIAPTTFAR
jgi:hypothetical protein